MSGDNGKTVCLDDSLYVVCMRERPWDATLPVVKRFFLKSKLVAINS